MMENFCKNNQQLKTVHVFCKKAAYMFDKVFKRFNFNLVIQKNGYFLSYGCLSRKNKPLGKQENIVNKYNIILPETVIKEEDKYRVTAITKL